MKELNWVFQDVHEGGVAHRAGIRPGDLLVAVDDRRLVPPTVPVFRMGWSSSASVQRPSGVTDRMRIDVPKPKSSRHLVNLPRAVAHLSLPSQVGYLKINMFRARLALISLRRSRPQWLASPCVIAWSSISAGTPAEASVDFGLC